MPRPVPGQLGDLLKQVSRSFYLTLHILPAPIREPIGLAYLIARAADTIADTRLVSVERRRLALREMRAAIRDAAEGQSSGTPDFGSLAETHEALAGQGSQAERLLLEEIPEVLEKLSSLPLGDRLRIRELLEIVTLGQETDLSRFGAANADRISALDCDNDLEEYTYRVAGCVGEFWTRMCRAHLFPSVDLDEISLMINGIRFGKGLQLVNILRDLPRDLREGRCYIPRARLAVHGLEPMALLDAREMERFRPLYASYLEQARELLAAGWAYTNALPRRQVRVRLACAWPILIAMKTLTRLRAGNVLDCRHRIKVPRGEVHRLMVLSVLCYPMPRAWDRLFDRAGADLR